MLLFLFVDQVVIVLQGISKRTLNAYESASDCVDVGGGGEEKSILSSRELFQ